MAVIVSLTAIASAQRWQELQGRTKSGVVALHQAVLDAGSDALALIVASHPDDRYVLPAIYLRYLYGVRVAVLLATRGGGGQNSLGPESGDALERIRTLETEAGCWQFDGDAYYLDRPDRGYRRTAVETFDEWGRKETLTELVRLLRRIRPEIVLTTHHLEETHGHDLALTELLPEAVDKAADASFEPQLDEGSASHRVRALFMGATSAASLPVISIRSDQFEPWRGASLRRLAHQILAQNHLSPGVPAPIDTIFGPEMSFVSVPLGGASQPVSLTDAMSSVFDDGMFPGDATRAGSLREQLASLPGLLLQREELIVTAKNAIAELRSLPCAPDSEIERKCRRRVEALQRVLLQAASVRIEVEPQPGAVAVPGEDLSLGVRIHAGGTWGIEAIAVESTVGEAVFEAAGRDLAVLAPGQQLQATVTYRVPLVASGRGDLMEGRFRGDRFDPPVRMRFLLTIAGVVVPVPIVVPVDMLAPVELDIVPRMLLFPASREQVRFTVKLERNSKHQVVGNLEWRAPAGYRVEGERTAVELDKVRGDIFEFTLHAPPDRKSGVDIVRVSFGGSTVRLPVHKVDVRIDPKLRIGIVRSKDDALTSVIGSGGFGLRWTGLSDLDLGVGDLDQFDAIVVDVRALRGRPEARRSFRRLLDFSSRKGKRLVVLYHKDTEFQPLGEGFRGAPLQPFQIGRDRITRADSPVKVLLPEHVLLTRPNRVLPSDWDGWEQERGLYFPSVYSRDYQELLEMHDPGLPPQRSALLYARTQGGGEYVYCALALWRQWKKLHPGSVRILANLLTPQRPRE